MKQKTFHAPLELKADGEPGEFSAIFATMNVVDHDDDLTVPGAFPIGQGVVIEPWNHDRALPVGKAIIQADEEKAWVEGQFLLDTMAGREHYETVKALGPLTEWSYTFWIQDFSSEMRDGKRIRILKKLDVAGVSPVTRGAGLGTQTLDIKGSVPEPDGSKPYPNEHACRLREPGEFQADSFRRTIREHEGKKYAVIMGKLKDETAMTEQAYRYSKDVWDADQAKKHCGEAGGRFEPAAETNAGKGEGQTGDGDPSSADLLAKIDVLEMSMILQKARS